MTDKQKLHAIISGRVQGVNFRYYTQKTANELGVTGWVRNNPDGTVEVTAEGPHGKLEELLQFLRQGPPAARVRSVEETWGQSSGRFDDFRITYR